MAASSGDEVETRWRPITTDQYLALKRLLPGITQVVLPRGGWALVLGDELLAVWRPDTVNLRNILFARVQ